MKSEETVTGTVFVDGSEYSLKCSVAQPEISFTVEAQNMRSGEIWRGTFTSEYVENVTHKTGSYKQYSVFLEMLRDALTTATESVYLELLTYADLVALKTGKVPTKQAPDSKRYVILTYKVKYDTVHYPLPLQYAGKLSPVELQNNVTKLQKEIERLKEQIVSVGSPVRKRPTDCCKDTAQLKEELVLLRKGGKNQDQSHLIKTLQTSLRNLESDMIREKNKYQRTLDKKNHECRQLVQEVENLRSENRTLTVRLRSVTTELNVAKRNRLSSYSSNRSARSITPDQHRSRQNLSSSLERSRTNSRTRGASRSAERRSTERRSTERRSVERRSVERNERRSNSVDRSGRPKTSGYASRPSSTRSAPETRRRTPSPCLPRFDPSAYVREKQQKLKERKCLRERQTNARTHVPRARSTPFTRESPGNHSIYHKPPPSGIVKDIIKNNLLSGRRSTSCSSIDSCRSNNSNNSRRPKKKKQKSYSYPSSGSEYEYDKENDKKRRGGNYLNSPGVNVSNVSFTKDSEIAEIDARLNALQSYLKDAQKKQYPV